MMVYIEIAGQKITDYFFIFSFQKLDSYITYFIRFDIFMKFIMDFFQLQLSAVEIRKTFLHRRF